MVTVASRLQLRQTGKFLENSTTSHSVNLDHASILQLLPSTVAAGAITSNGIIGMLQLLATGRAMVTTDKEATSSTTCSSITRPKLDTISENPVQWTMTIEGTHSEEVL